MIKFVFPYPFAIRLLSVCYPIPSFCYPLFWKQKKNTTTGLNMDVLLFQEYYSYVYKIIQWYYEKKFSKSDWRSLIWETSWIKKQIYFFRGKKTSYSHFLSIRVLNFLSRLKALLNAFCLLRIIHSWACLYFLCEAFLFVAYFVAPATWHSGVTLYIYSFLLDLFLP